MVCLIIAMVLVFYNSIGFPRFIDWEAKYFFKESAFIGLTRSSPSILDNNKASLENAFFTTKGPSLFGAHLLWSSYGKRQYFSSVQDLLRGILEVEPSCRMIWPSLFDRVDDDRLWYPLFTDQIQLFISNICPFYLF